MKFSIYAAQSIALPITLSLGHLWTPKRLFVQGLEKEGGLRSDVRGRSTINVVHVSKESPADGDTNVNLKKKADVGILSELVSVGISSSPGNTAVRRLQLTCDEGFVDCVDGKLAFSDMSCADACEGECCVGDDYTCSGLTAKVCKDGSCGGAHACYEATIGYIVGSCDGKQSCAYAGLGSSNYMVDSCNGDKACYDAGSTGNIVNSCNSVYGCRSVARFGSLDGIRGSCNAEEACFDVAANVGETYGTLDYCCNSFLSECASDGEGNLDTNESFQACFVPSAQPSTAPSFQPSAFDRQILTKVNGIESDVEQISTDISDVITGTSDPVACDSEIIAGDVTVVSQNNAVTRIVLLVTSGGKTTNVDSTPKLYTLDGTSEVEVSVQAATNLSTGVYLILFDSPKKAFWVKFSVGGEEGAALFNTE